MTDHDQHDEDNAIMARLRDLSQADGEAATTEAASRDQEAWDLNVTNGSANAAHIWALGREHDARAKAWEAFATLIQVIAVMGFIASAALLVLHVIQAFQ